MNKLLLIAAVAIASCNSKNTTQPIPDKPIETKVIAVYQNPDGSKNIDLMIMVVYGGAKFDSVKGKNVFIVDTAWGRPVRTPLLDSIGKQRIDSNGVKQFSFGYTPISKDSVNWRIQLKSVDSLLKK